MRLRLAFVLASLAGSVAFAQADERILSFVSDVAIEKNSSLDVTETIRVQAENNQIRHGIVRDFPTRYQDRTGAAYIVGFKVESVTRDGAAEPYTLESLANGQRIRIGSADKLVSRGPHDYVIRYHTTRQVGFFANYDELYWNATGTGWTFPIDQAEARITLPESIPFGDTAFYTGPQGAAGADATIVSKRPGEIIFRTTSPLPVGSGLTVAAAWPKGIVAPPNSAERGAWWVEDNLGALFALLGTIGAIAYFGHAWRRVGRDPDHGTIIPLFEPPLGLSAPAVRYIAEMDFDNRTFTAALLELGVRGRVKLSDVGKTLQIEHQEGGQASVDPAEQAVEGELFKLQPVLTMTQSNHQRFAAAKASLQRQLETTYRNSIFKQNFGWLAVGVAITLATYMLTVFGFTEALGPDQSFLAIAGLAFASVPAIAIGFVIKSDASGKSWIQRIFAFLITAFVVLVFAVMGLVAFVVTIHAPLDAAALVLPLILAPITVSAFFWMRSPTPDGQKLRDSIAGFRQYLSIAEEHRLEVLHPPEKTPELFERYLPYAVALNVENAWAARFADVLAAAGANAAVAHWYATSTHRDAAGLVSRLGSDLSSTIASASTAPGSSSGSGGGGSSGGGGGGGGGSGW